MLIGGFLEVVFQEAFFIYLRGFCRIIDAIWAVKQGNMDRLCIKKIEIILRGGGRSE